MNTTTLSRLDVVPLSQNIGGEIRGIDLREGLDGDTVKAIRAAWLKHLVLVFRDQRFGQEDLIRATAYFGEIGPMSRPAKYFPKGYEKLLPNIMMISNIRENGEVIGAVGQVVVGELQALRQRRHFRQAVGRAPLGRTASRPWPDC